MTPPDSTKHAERLVAMADIGCWLKDAEPGFTKRALRAGAAALRREAEAEIDRERVREAARLLQESRRLATAAFCILDEIGAADTKSASVSSPSVVGAEAESGEGGSEPTASYREAAKEPVAPLSLERPTAEDFALLQARIDAYDDPPLRRVLAAARALEAVEREHQRDLRKLKLAVDSAKMFNRFLDESNARLARAEEALREIALFNRGLSKGVNPAGAFARAYFEKGETE